jgi:hypothetical protein
MKKKERPILQVGERQLVVGHSDGRREIVDHKMLLALHRRLKVAKKYVEDCQAELRAAVEECGSEYLEVVQQGSGRDFKGGAPHYEELPVEIRKSVTEEDYDGLLTVSVTDLERIFVANLGKGEGSRADAEDRFRYAIRKMVTPRPPRTLLRERRDGN